MLNVNPDSSSYQARLTVILTVMLFAALLSAAGCAAPAPPQPLANANSSSSADTEEPVVYVPGALEVAVWMKTDAQVGSFEFTVEFNPDEIALYHVESRLPAGLRLEYDRTQFASGKVRLIGLQAPDAEVEPGSAAVDGMTGQFAVAHLTFAPADEKQIAQRVQDKKIRWTFSDAHVFSPLPDQKLVGADLEARFFLSVPRTQH